MTNFIIFFVSGCTLFGLAAAGAMGTINLNLVQCLVFSGLIVAVDPVAVSSLHLTIPYPSFLHLICLKSVIRLPPPPYAMHQRQSRCGADLISTYPYDERL